MDIEPTDGEILADASFIEMKCYIKYCLYFGCNTNDIKKALLGAGWTNEEIDKAFNLLKTGVKKISEKTLDVPKPVQAEVSVPPPMPIIEVPKPSSS